MSPEVAAVVDALVRPSHYGGPVPAFASPERHREWLANAVLNALAELTFTTRQDA